MFGEASFLQKADGANGEVRRFGGRMPGSTIPNQSCGSFAEDRVPKERLVMPSAGADPLDVEFPGCFESVEAPDLEGGVGRPGVDGVVQSQQASSGIGSAPWASEEDEDFITRTLSGKSLDTVKKLSGFMRSFDDIEASMEQILASVQTSAIPSEKACDELAQLEATLDRLQCKGVDSVDTFELSSGKDLAKSIRKELTRRAEKIHDDMDESFKAIKHAQQRGL